MTIKIKRKVLENGILSISLLAIIAFVLIGVSFTTNYVIGATNQTNVTVYAYLNVTNTPPNITSVTLDDDIDPPVGEIDLTSYAVTIVTCNATIFDSNGWQDIDPDSVNATLYIKSVGVNAENDNNDHYTNSSCGRCVQVDATTAGCDCTFAMQYYANSSSEWVCNISVTDKAGTGKKGDSHYLNFTVDAVSNDTTVTQLLALDTPTDTLDYGNLSVTQTSIAVARNVTNGGNIPFNLTLRGFGGENDSVTNDNYTMICNLGNISFGYHRYVVGINTSFDEMKNLTNQSINTNFTLSHRTNDASEGTREDKNETYWRLQIPLGVGGLCNGTIIFGAVEST